MLQLILYPLCQGTKFLLPKREICLVIRASFYAVFRLVANQYPAVYRIFGQFYIRFIPYYILLPGCAKTYQTVLGTPGRLISVVKIRKKVEGWLVCK